MTTDIERYIYAQQFVSGVETITPDIAKEMLERNTHNRPVSANYVAKLAREMATDNWQLNGQSINFTNEGVLLDGQHRLMACIKANVPFTTVVSGGLDKDTFKTTDCGRGRNLSQMIGIKEKKYYSAAAAIIRNYMDMVDGKNSYNKEQTSITVSSLTGRSVREYFDIYENMNGVVNKYAALSNKLAQKMNHFPISPGYSGAMMMFLVMNLGYTFEFVYEFFDQLYSYQTPEDSNIRLLWKKMIDIRGDRNANHVYTAKYKLALLHKAWNLYATGKTVKQLNIGSNEVELISAFDAHKLL